MGAGCAEEGVVEIAWSVVDRLGEPIYPAGVLSADRRDDSCRLPGRAGEASVPYRLQLQLDACPPDAQSADECDTTAFSCAVHRASMMIPAATEPYEFTVRALTRRADRDEDCPELESDCIAVPGPRNRKVRDGLVTDLQVYQVVVDVDAEASGRTGRLDLEGCGCG